ncbi:MAG: glycosyltransferase [Bacteroidetes bacterium]|nr:glycosyltransferase [Bacteroidota bacterium]
MTTPHMVRRQVRRVEHGRLAYYLEAADAAFWDHHWSGMLTRGAYAEAELGFLGWFEEPFSKHLPRTGKILEAGCGIGQHVVALRVRGYDAVGVEWASRTVEAARSFFPTLPVEAGDVTALNVPDGTYAGYISLGVMEHRQEGPEPFLREAFRVVAPGGVAFISVPHFHPLRRLKGVFGLYGGNAEGLGFYQYAYSTRDFSTHLRNAGFAIVDQGGYDCVKGLKDELSWLRRLLAHDRYGARVRSRLSGSKALERIFGHMMLFVCRKPEQTVATPAVTSAPATLTTAGSRTRLALFFTRGVSLRAWDQIGMLDREMALYKRLRDCGIDVTLVTYGGSEDLSYSQQFPGIRILANSAGLPQDQYEAAIEQIHAVPLAQIDLFKSNQTNGADVALRVARHFGRPLVARCGYMWSSFAAMEGGDQNETTRRARAAEEFVFTNAARVVVTTPDMAADLASRLPETAKKIVVIPNYVDTERFSPAPVSAYRWDVLFVGRLVPQKNIAALLDALAPLPLRLGIVGQGPLEAQLREHPASQMGKVDWLGRVPSQQLVEYFRSSRVFVLPSLFEGHPKTLLEAMASGVPVVGTNVPGIANVVIHEHNGLLCPPTSEGIRFAVQRMLSDARLAAKLALNARSFVVEHCALDHIVEREAALLRETATAETRSTGTAGGHAWSDDLDRMTDAECGAAIGGYLAARARKTAPAQGLTLLFGVEDLLYSVEGELAIRYGDGVHTKHRHTKYHDFFVDRVHKGEAVLDVGCGVGAVAYDLARRSDARVTGIDLSEENIAAARRMHAHPRIQYVVGDALRLESTGATDVLILSNVLEHIADRPEFLRKLVILSHPSRVLIRVPLFERDWRIPLRKELQVEYRLDPTHETEYTLDSFASEMQEAGLDVTHQEVRWGEIWAECEPVEAAPVPRVSVIMSTHNDSAYLPLAMESILQQTFKDFECIIVDDASTDATAGILERYTDARLRIIRHGQNMGLTRSLNEALALSRGVYVARMDGDDIALPDRFQKQVAFLDRNPDVGLVGTAFMYIDGQNTVTGTEPVFVSDAEIRSRLLKHNCFGHGTVMIRLAVVRALGGYDESFPFAQDYDLWLRIAERTAVANLADRLYCWRRTAGTISSRHEEEQEACAARAQQNARLRGVLPVPLTDRTLAPTEVRHD